MQLNQYAGYVPFCVHSILPHLPLLDASGSGGVFFSVQRKLGGRELSAVKGILFHQCDLYDLISVHTEDSEGNGVSDLKAGFDVL